MSVREFLMREFDILEVIDLGDTKLFEAAVLPALFFGRKRGHTSPAARYQSSFLRIYQADNGDSPAPADKAASVIDILGMRRSGHYEVGRQRYAVATGLLKLPSSPAEPWAMATDAERRWVAAVEAGKRFRLAELAKVRVGIKTTADSVFVRSDWDSLPVKIRPEDEVLHVLISHDDIRQSRHPAHSSARRILYTHEVRDGRRTVIDFSRFPRARAYLEAHRKRLEARRYVADAGREWFEIWVPQDPAAWSEPKIVFPDISLTPRFFIDADGCFVDGNCYWITLAPGVMPEVLTLIPAIANSKFMTRYHDLCFSNRLYSGRRRYLTQYVERYPVPDPSNPAAKELIDVGRRWTLAASVSDRNLPPAEIEALVARAFGVSEPFA
jgi:hypothetical protein